MKKETITISFDDEKLNALAFFMGKENRAPQTELENALNEFYEKYVPTDTRDYLDSKNAAPTKSKPKRPAKPMAKAAPAMHTAAENKTEVQ